MVRRGDKGEDVKKVQVVVGVTADGIFGAKTEEAVMAWQSANGLEPDGIVGNATWSKMFGDTSGKAVDPSVKYMPLPKHVTYSKGRTITYLAIHYTGSGHSREGRAKGTFNTFLKREASADFCVDDVDVVQFNPDIANYYCWAVGDKKQSTEHGGGLYGVARNKNTISIEICSSVKSGYGVSKGNHEGWYFTDAALDNAVKLAKILIKKYNIPKDRVVRHYDISGKLCPGIVGWNNGRLYKDNGSSTGEMNNSAEWDKFKNRLYE